MARWAGSNGVWEIKMDNKVRFMLFDSGTGDSTHNAQKEAAHKKQTKFEM